jgi:hypothetical protein
MQKRIKWTFEMAQKEALNYQTRNAFNKGNRNAYRYACNNKLLDVICSHMSDIRTTWTYETCEQEALKYQTRFDFQQGVGGAYKAALRNGWLDEICKHMKKGTSEYFIERAKHVHGDSYDYSKVEYTSSDTNVNIICKLHGEYPQTPSTHLSGAGCGKCAIVARKRTMLERYGVENPSQNKEIKEKKKLTNLSRFGVEYSFQSEEIKEKTKQTNIERYGTKSPLGNKEIQEKFKQTNLKRYGVEHPTQNKEIQEKTRKTNLERYGVENPQQNKEIKEKTKKTNLERYGVENPFSSNAIQIKIIDNIRKKYKRNHYPKKHMADIYPYLDDKEWLFEQYITLNKTAEQIRDELKISNWTVCHYLHKHEIQVRASARYSMKCIQWLESIMQQEQIFIQHAGNIGEHQISGTRYKADGYCEETNTIYEFHGDCFHGNPDLFEHDTQCNPFNDYTAKELYDATKERENKIISLGYNLVIMWENDFNKLQ